MDVATLGLAVVSGALSGLAVVVGATWKISEKISKIEEKTDSVKRDFDAHKTAYEVFKQQESEQWLDQAKMLGRIEGLLEGREANRRSRPG